jgi:hypothetical protein
MQSQLFQLSLAGVRLCSLLRGQQLCSIPGSMVSQVGSAFRVKNFWSHPFASNCCSLFPSLTDSVMNVGERAVDALRIQHRPSLGTQALDGKVGLNEVATGFCGRFLSCRQLV